MPGAETPLPAVELCPTDDLALLLVRPDMHLDIDLARVGEEPEVEVRCVGQRGAGDVHVSSGVGIGRVAADSEVLSYRDGCWVAEETV
ncbi:MAG: hypothetical protein JWP44_4412 [Mucilaginibacter sp.]|nr:hypothetical protein [Mucilaginibacter sp.]